MTHPVTRCYSCGMTQGVTGNQMEKKVVKQAFIIEKAREIFLDKGLINTVMDDIAAKVGLTRRSLYRYFESKEDLAYETTTQLLTEWNDYHIKVFGNLKGSGLSRLETFLYHLIDYMTKRRDVMKYLGEFDFFFKDGQSNRPSSVSKKRFDSIILESDQLFKQLIAIGMEDGSIKKDINIDLMVTTISQVLWGFGQRIAIRGELIKEESGFNGLDLIENQVSIYISALKGNK